MTEALLHETKTWGRPESPFHPDRLVRCTYCAMDNTDPEIEFDSSGRCNHCKEYERAAEEALSPHEDREIRLNRLVSRIKEDGRGKPYDVVLGVSGGVDSSYTAWVTKELGLRALAVHFDNGWNSEIAVRNIHKLLTTLDLDLHTKVVDWQEFRDIQLAFLRASIPNAELPTDHAIRAVLYETANGLDIKYLIVGSNVVTEGILPSSWGYNNKDLRLIQSVQDRYGTVPIDDMPTLSLSRYVYLTLVRGIKRVPILNYVEYRREDAIAQLVERCGWENYGRKHGESLYTRFFQEVILPRKFNIDKRKAHLSTMICSGQITRDEALTRLNEDLNDPGSLRWMIKFVLDKLELSVEEFEAIMTRPIRTYEDFANLDWIYRLLRGLKHASGLDPRAP